MELEFLLPLLNSLLVKYPAIASIIMVVGICRLAMKPVFAIALRYLELEPSPEKQQKVVALLNSRGWKTFAFAVDLLFSVKLPYAPGSLGARIQAKIKDEKGQVPGT